MACRQISAFSAVLFAAGIDIVARRKKGSVPALNRENAPASPLHARRPVRQVVVRPRRGPVLPAAQHRVRRLTVSSTSPTVRTSAFIFTPEDGLLRQWTDMGGPTAPTQGLLLATSCEAPVMIQTFCAMLFSRRL